MIQIATALPTVSAGPARPILLAAQSGASNFALALSSLLVPGAAPAALPGETPVPDAPVAGRQIAAEPGKELPEIGLDVSSDEEAPEQNCNTDDEAPASEDLPFAWFALPAPPSTDAAPVTLPVIGAKGIVAEKPKTGIALPEATAPDAPVTAQPKSVAATQPEAESEAAPVLASIAPKVTQVPQRPAERPVAVAPRATVPIDPIEAPAASAPAATAVSAPAPAVSTPAPAATVVVQPPLAAAVAPAAPQPAPRTEATPVAIEATAPREQAAAPAAKLLRQPVAVPAQPLTVASLIAQASVQAVAQPIAFAPLRRSLGETDQPVLTTLAAPGAPTLHQVAATPDAQQGTLDMRRQEWMGKMIETVEAMRDAAPVKETRISLVPDALGKVDISVRHDGDRIHVHFATETQAARQILTDAQPRLTELAEARGIRLGQTSVDSQSAGAQSGQRHSDAQRPQNPSAPASARAAEDQLISTDDRVA